ncbi:RDD family protein [Gleimia hominis]|uniref:RDD family protein n=1 Tax=Gleimia hominis TaxID=595468 RepID=A0ABU3I946_9ACTO|nr:RDD family protein [Gleimia hominis]MDT3766894.1 RDD family protein [Gleimia hominis]
MLNDDIVHVMGHFDSTESQRTSLPQRPARQRQNLTTDDFVVGEGVALATPPVSVVTRLLEGIIDCAALALTSILLFVAYLLIYPFKTNATNSVVLVTIIGTMLFLVPATIEAITHGKSLGKWMCGTRVVRFDQGPISARHAFTRALIGVAEIWLTSGSLATISSFVDKHARRLGDIAAGTYVISERVKLQETHPMQVPRDLEGWARSADISLPTGLALAIRQFLNRKETMMPQARQAMGQQLLDSARAHVLPMPSEQVGAEAALTAILAERTARDLARIDRNRELAQRVLVQRS